MYIYVIIDDVDELTDDEIELWEHNCLAWSSGWIDMIELKKKMDYSLHISSLIEQPK